MTRLKDIERRIAELGEIVSDDQILKEGRLGEEKLRCEWFSQILRRSLFIVGYAAFEKHLQGICDGLRSEFHLRLSEKHLSGKGIERAKNYLKRVVQIAFPEEDPNWARIKMLNKFRNTLVHAPDSIFLAGAYDHYGRLRSEFPGLSTDTSRSIEVGPEFLPAVVRTFQQFDTKLLSAVNEFHRRELWSVQ